MPMKSEVWKEIEFAADGLVEKCDGMTRAKAIDRALQLQPDLYNRWKAADPDLAPVQKEAPPDYYRKGTAKALAYKQLEEITNQIRKADESFASAFTRATQTPEGQEAYRRYSGVDSDLTADERVAKTEAKAVLELDRELSFKGVDRPTIDGAIAKFRRQLARKQQTPIRKRVVEVAKDAGTSHEPRFRGPGGLVPFDRCYPVTKDARGPVSFDEAFSKLRGE